MDKETAAVVGLGAVGLGAVTGVLVTKTAGWGKYSSSTLLLTLALFVAAILLVVGKLEPSSFSNVLFAIVGYAGGLIASKKAEE
jgi:hypothetical protein